MKRLVTYLIIATVLCLLAFNCKKSNDNTSSGNACKTCEDTVLSHTLDADSVYYFLPTAFTPNGDGLNDVLQLIYSNLNVDSSTITIWNQSGTEVFSGNIATRWEGTDLNGNKCAAGHYPVYASLRTNKGAIVHFCSCVTILQYSGTCISTGGANYYFPDQIDPNSGVIYVSAEKLCP